jgi:hypothetical protein
MTFVKTFFLLAVTFLTAEALHSQTRWEREPTTYRNIRFGETFAEIVKSQGLVFMKLEGKDIIARPGAKYSWEVAWKCNLVGNMRKPPGVIADRICSTLTGGPFEGLQNTPNVEETFAFVDDKFSSVGWSFKESDYATHPGMVFYRNPPNPAAAADTQAAPGRFHGV